MRRPGLAGLVVVALLALLAPATASARDRDHDALPDRWEKGHGLSAKSPSAAGDPDHDRVDNRNEHREGTHPRDRDTDDDGRPDGREDRDHDKLSNADEDATGNDPRDRDTDDDGVSDGREQAGVVRSFDGEELVIELSRGGRVSGMVDESTGIYCESEKEAERGWKRSANSSTAPATAAAAEDDEPGDEDEPGDDEGDPEDSWEDEGEEGWEDDEGEGEDDESDEGLDEAGSCPLSRLKPGARVHGAVIETAGDGTWVVEIELIG